MHIIYKEFVKKTIFFLFFLFSGTMIAQQNFNIPIDFEPDGFGANWGWTVFENHTNPPLEIVSNPSPDALNASATVAKFTALQQGAPWVGCESTHGTDLGSFSFDEDNSSISIMVWKSVVSDVGLKFVDPSNAALTEIKVSNTVVNQWEQLTFDFSPYIGQYPQLVDQIIIFPDFDLNGRTQDNIIYFDNIFGEYVAGPISGCTDESYPNFNPDASVDDGSCGECNETATITFNVDASNVVNADYDNVMINGSWDSFGDNNEFWGSWGVTLEDLDGIYSGSITLPAGDYEYVHALSGAADGWSGWGVVGNAPDECALGVNPQTGDPAPNYYFSVECGDTINLPVLCFGECTECAEGIVSGCTDETAINYDSESNVDNGSCIYSTTFNVDMSCSGIEFTNVYITGPFTEWCGDCYLLTDEDGDGIYSSTFDFVVDVEYMYEVDNWVDQEDLVDDMNAGAECAPVTDFVSYANRLVSPGSTTNDTYGSCSECIDEILGCTDPEAWNYNELANADDGTCDYCELITVNFSVNAGDVVSADYDNVVINGSFAGPWFGWGVTLADEDGDGVYTGSTQVEASVTHEYVHALTGAADGWSGWGVTGFAPESCSLNDTTPNYFFSGECGETIDLPTVCFGSCTNCTNVEVLGCIDTSADNFDPNANTDDGSCTYCGNFEAVLISSPDATAAGACDGSVQVTGQGGSSNYSFSVFDLNGVPQNPFGLCAGTYTAQVTDNGSSCTDELTVTIAEPVVAENPCDITPTGMYVDNIIHNRVVFNWSAPSAAPSHYMIRYRAVGTSSWTVMTAGPVNSNEFTGTSRTRYFMEAGTTYQWSMRARVLNEDGSMNCQSSWSSNSEYTTLPECANLENLSVSTEANWVTLMADAPAVDWGVWQSKGKMREVGTNSYRYVNGGSEGAINFLKGNFDASTEYEWHTKSWCTGNVDANGDADPMYHSGWGDFSTFTTEAPCDAVATNLTTTTNGAYTAITMNWDTPESGAPDHYFLELTDETTGQVWAWNAIAGNSNSKTKFGLTTGNDFSWRIRGACGTNGTSWATSFTSPVYYTLGGERLAGPVANLDVYPNPSRDIFNVTFESAKEQTMTVRVVNMIGEEAYTEELIEFVGSYNKVIDMNAQPKGVYFLEITTTYRRVKKKVVLQ